MRGRHWRLAESRTAKGGSRRQRQQQQQLRRRKAHRVDLRSGSWWRMGRRGPAAPGWSNGGSSGRFVAAVVPDPTVSCRSSCASSARSSSARSCTPTATGAASPSTPRAGIGAKTPTGLRRSCTAASACSVSRSSSGRSACTARWPPSAGLAWPPRPSRRRRASSRAAPLQSGQLPGRPRPRRFARPAPSPGASWLEWSEPGRGRARRRRYRPVPSTPPCRRCQERMAGRSRRAEESSVRAQRRTRKAARRSRKGALRTRRRLRSLRRLPGGQRSRLRRAPLARVRTTRGRCRPGKILSCQIRCRALATLGLHRAAGEVAPAPMLPDRRQMGTRRAWPSRSTSRSGTRVPARQDSAPRRGILGRSAGQDAEEEAEVEVRRRRFREEVRGSGAMPRMRTRRTKRSVVRTPLALRRRQERAVLKAAVPRRHGRRRKRSVTR